MSAIDQALEANLRYSEHQHRPGLSKYPKKHLFVLTCMDSRILVETVLGLHLGEAHVCRNAGPTVTDDVLRSITLSQHALGTREILIIGHTDCGLLNLDESSFAEQVMRETGRRMSRAFPFYSFSDVERKIRTELGRVKSYRWLHPDSLVRGFVMDVKSGMLKEVAERAIAKAAKQTC
jgi:carbonic anhydrase